MASMLTARSGLAVRASASAKLGSDDLNQVVDGLLAERRVLAAILGGEAIYTGGAAALGDLPSGTSYPAVTMLVNDDSGNPWPVRTASSTAITFNVTSTAAGDARLYAVPAQMAGVSPAAATGVVTGVTFVADDVANAAPAHSLLLGSGTITASAFTAYTASSLAPSSSVVALLSTTQTISGAKTFSTAPGFSSLTASRLLGLTAGNVLESPLLTSYVTGTANQVTVAASGGGVVLSLPQSIATASSPQFAGLGIGVAASSGRLTVVNTSAPAVYLKADGVGCYLDMYTYRADTGGAGLRHYAARGSAASPAAVQSGDVIAHHYGSGHDGTNQATATNIRSVVDGTVSTGVVPGKLGFWTATAAGTLTLALEITSAQTVAVKGKLTVPTSTPASATATGVAGTITWDASYIYICTATDTWKRAAIATW